jgi:hypothetical protein
MCLMFLLIKILVEKYNQKDMIFCIMFGLPIIRLKNYHNNKHIMGALRHPHQKYKWLTSNLLMQIALQL